MERSFGGICAAFGRFDGMHAGHTAVLKTLGSLCAENGWDSALYTFPAGNAVLTTEDEKAALAAAAGVRNVISGRPLPDAPDEAVHTLRLELPDLRAVVLGSGFVRNGFGYADYAAAFRAEGIDVFPVEDVCADGLPVTSECICAALDAGDCEACRRLCGRPYLLTGFVTHGRGLGHTVGMPTANLAVPPEKRIPGEGVYATVARVSQGVFMGLTNVGRRPSVDDEDRITVETQLLDFKGDLYGAPMSLEFHFFIRSVMKFDSLDAVRRQVEADAAHSMKRLETVFRDIVPEE